MDRQVFRCQSCRAKLNITGTDVLSTSEASQASPRPSSSADTAHSRVDDSFIVLEPGAKKGAVYSRTLGYRVEAHRNA